MSIKQRRLKHVATLEVQFAAEAIQLRKQASLMPPGDERDRLLRKARQDETASHMNEWLRSPGIRPSD